MASTVYYGSPYQRTLSADETLPAKLDRVLERLCIRDRVKDQLVAIKMRLGFNIGYSTIHPVFVRKVVQAVKDGGGRPFVTDSPGSHPIAKLHGPYKAPYVVVRRCEELGLGTTDYTLVDVDGRDDGRSLADQTTVPASSQ